MSKLNLELFIARRISSSQGGRRNVMVRIASLTVAVGTAVMLIALAVVGGFKGEITDKLVGFSSHVRIVNPDTNSSFETSPVVVDSALVDSITAIPGFRHISTYALKGGVLKTPAAIQGIALKGVGTDYDTAFLARHLTQGALPNLGDSVRRKDLLVSGMLARTLELSVGDRVEILFISASRPVRRDRFKVSGFYSTGMDELDKAFVFTDIRNVQRLNGWSPEQVSGYEVMADDFGNLAPFATQVADTVYAAADSAGDALKTEDVVALNPNLFDWLRAHNVNAAVIIVIMLLVALLNMASAMLIILLEKISMIGILKALGMRNWSVQKIFLVRSWRIVLPGMLYGSVAALAIVLLQKYTGLVRLDSSGYMLSEVPVRIDLAWWLGLWLALPIVMTALLVIPAMVVTSIKPDRTIRYN